jgi:LysM repeat protein
MNEPKTFHVVQDGDTLGTIAKAHNTSVVELVKLNRIANPDRIATGQRLALPPAPTKGDVEPDDEEWGVLQLRFVDAINRDISGLAVTVDNGMCKPFDMVTDAMGLLPAFAVHPDHPPVKISVARAAGGTKEVARIQPTRASQMATLVSPKVLVSANLRRHEGPPRSPSRLSPRSWARKRVPAVRTATRSMRWHWSAPTRRT